MFKNDFDWQEFKESLGEDNYKRLYIPTTEDDYLSQQISNTLKLGIFRETLSYPVKSHEIIKINDIQQDGLFRYKGINGLRDFSLNDNPGNGTVQNSPPNRIKGELLLLDKQVELMWNKADNFNDKFKVLTFQSTRLLTLQAFDDANKRAMKEVMTSSLNKLMAEYNVPHVAQNLDLSGISSEALREAVHSNNIAGMCNEMATIYSIDPSFLNISDVEIPPYQVMAKMDNLEIQRKDLAQEVPLCTYFLKLDIEGELLDAKLHDGLFENNPDTKLQWVRPSDIKDRMNFEQSMQLKKETKGFLNSFFKKKKGLSLSLKPLIEPATRDEFLKKITSADLPYNFTKSLVFKALTIEPGYHSVTKVLLNRLKGIEELKEVKPLSSKTRMANYPSLKGFTEEKTALMAEEKTSVVNENDAVDTINHIHNLRECVLRLKKEESKGTLLEEWKENDGEILLENSLKTMLHNNNKNQAYCDSGLKNHLEYFKVMLSDLDELSHIPLEDKEEYRENLSEASESLREIILFQEKLKESNALVVIQKNKDWIMNAPGTTQSESDLSLEDDISAGVIQSDLEVSIEHSSEDKEESFEHKM